MIRKELNGNPDFISRSGVLLGERPASNKRETMRGVDAGGKWSKRNLDGHKYRCQDVYR